MRIVFCEGNNLQQKGIIKEFSKYITGQRSAINKLLFELWPCWADKILDSDIPNCLCPIQSTICCSKKVQKKKKEKKRKKILKNRHTSTLRIALLSLLRLLACFPSFSCSWFHNFIIFVFLLLLLLLFIFCKQ